LGDEDSVEGFIKEVYTNYNKEEYLILETGMEIRLDKIIKVGPYLKHSFH
jgi:hypothetical protein